MKALEKIKTNFCISTLFKGGIGAGFSSAERVYLHGKGINTVVNSRRAIFETATEFYKKRLLTDKSGSLYLVLAFENTEDCLDSSDVELVKDFPLTLDQSIEMEKVYDDDSEVYRFIYLFNVPWEVADRLLLGKLNRHFDRDPYHMCEVYLIDLDVKYIFNVYDDRGLDFLSLQL